MSRSSRRGRRARWSARGPAGCMRGRSSCLDQRASPTFCRGGPEGAGHRLRRQGAWISANSPTRFPSRAGAQADAGSSRSSPSGCESSGCHLSASARWWGSPDDADGVDVGLSDGPVVARGSTWSGATAGGALSAGLAGIEFPRAGTATISSIIANVELTETPEWGVRQEKSASSRGRDRVQDRRRQDRLCRCGTGGACW